MASVLARKGYCLVQMWMTAEDREAAMDQAYDVTTWTLPKQEFEPAYMGYENNTKYAMLPDDNAAEEPEGALQQCDRFLTNTALILESYADVLGCSLWGRLSGMLRLPLSSRNEAKQLRPRGLCEQDYEEGRVTGHLNFLERRKLMMLLMIDNAGGELCLYPKEGMKMQPVRLHVAKNRLLVFRSDLMSYAYRPRGGSLALQTWVLSEPPVAGDGAGSVDLPTEMRGRRVHVASLAMRYPGEASGPDDFWSLKASGTDGQVRIPRSRFDVEEYYSANKDEGLTYACHGAFLSTNSVVMFDNAFFRVPSKEAELMSPGQKLVLEVGYEILSNAGFSMQTVRGAECGVFLGDSGNDWPLLTRTVGPGNCAHKWAGESNCITGARLSHVLDLRGPCGVTDTACSSSLVALNLGHKALRSPVPGQPEPNITSRVSTALVMGAGVLLSPKMYILYCGPGMLSARGRCFTFDAGADGYARGEGCGGLMLRSGDSEDEARAMLACLAGSAVNQDGRSASMTAPHGPSQQQCILASMADSSLSASEIAMAECHGTGTALGDPIEVGALRMVMQKRDTPMLASSTKANIGHLEAAAGITGVLKCIESIMHTCTPPDPHIYYLNPHLDVVGYPVYFANESSDYGTNCGVTGVSSFGFGGTNARADVWGRCLIGPRATKELNTGHWQRHRSVMNERVGNLEIPGPQISDRVYITGSWDAFSGMEDMEQADPGKYTAVVMLGETRREHFRVVVNRDPNLTIHPAVGSATAQAPIQGPGTEWKDKSWVLDGRDDRSDAALYRVTLSWGFSWERGEHMAIAWEPVVDGPRGAPARRYHHCYSIIGTWTSGKFREMARSREEPNLWTTTVRVGPSGQEEFQFARDNDWCQVIHPAVTRPRKTSVPVRGPDAAGAGKHWQIRGPRNELVTIQLRVLDGEITVTMASETNGVKTWQSTQDESWSEYYVTGTWNHWACAPMTADPQVSGIFRYHLVLGRGGAEEFQVVMEKDWTKILYPHVAGAELGEGILCGPDEDGHGMNWVIQGEEGLAVDITLDMNQVDRHWAVSWNALTSTAMLGFGDNPSALLLTH